MAKKSLKERLAERQQDLKKKGGGYAYFITPEGKTRFRFAWCGEEEDWALEVTTFYLGKDLGSVISPATFGEKCAIMEAYKEFSESKKESDRAFAKKFKPGRKYMAPAFRYKDEKGKEIDEENGVKLYLLAPSQYNDLLDLYLDDDNGDFTNPISGYDVKMVRTGKGKNDTEYSVMRCNPTKVPKQFRGPYNPEEMVKAIMPSYKETKEHIEKFLNLPAEEASSDEEKPKKKKKKNRDI